MFYDVFPTLAEIAKLSTPNKVDGHSIQPTLLGKEEEPHEYLYWEFFEQGFQQAVRLGPVRTKTFD